MCSRKVNLFSSGFVGSQAYQESRFKPDAKSWAGASKYGGDPLSWSDVSHWLSQKSRQKSRQKYSGDEVVKFVAAQYATTGRSGVCTRPT